MKTRAAINHRWSPHAAICAMLVAGFCFLGTPWHSPAWGRPGPPPFPEPASTWFVDMNRFSQSAHVNMRCEECHGPMNAGAQAHPNTAEAAENLKKKVKRTFDYSTCRKCHKKSYERYLTGAHATALEKEKKSGSVSRTGHAPTCGDCHCAHYAPSHLTRSQAGQRLTMICGSCHESQKESFLENYHGKMAVNLGYDKSAYCTDCHGAHYCLSLKDRGEVLNACQRCHPDAGPQFADVIIHDNLENIDKKSTIKQAGLDRTHMLGVLSFCFIVILLVSFYSHSFLLMLRKLHEQLRKHK